MNHDGRGQFDISVRRLYEVYALSSWPWDNEALVHELKTQNLWKKQELFNWLAESERGEPKKELWASLLVVLETMSTITTSVSIDLLQWLWTQFPVLKKLTNGAVDRKNRNLVGRERFLRILGKVIEHQFGPEAYNAKAGRLEWRWHWRVQSARRVLNGEPMADWVRRIEALLL